jgi:DNA-binding transcriptional ArsR family regulator
MSRSSALAVAQVRDAAPLFAALGDETRIRLLVRLSTNGPESITRLSEKSPTSRQAITKHLRVLAEAGLVRDEWHGRERIWRAEPKRIDDAQAYLGRISQLWDQALDRLKKSVED